MLVIVTQQKLTAVDAVRRTRDLTAELLVSCAGLFARNKLRCLAADTVAGLQVGLNTKNCWSLGKNAGHAGPSRLQHFLNDAVWDEDAVREVGTAGCDAEQQGMAYVL